MRARAIVLERERDAAWVQGLTTMGHAA